MSKKKKLSFILIAVFVAVLASASVISYSIARLQSNDIDSSSSSGDVSPALIQRGGALDNMDYYSNIDLIIENSHNGETFNIVEIFTASEYTSNSDLAQYISTGGFKKYVIDANATDKDKTMAPDMIKYTPIAVTADMELTNSAYEAENKALNEADLIYLTSKTYHSFDGQMSESVYNFLHTYALGDGVAGSKPLIIDNVTASTGGGGGNTSTTYKDLINAISGNYRRYHTFYWNRETVSLENFFNGNGDSYYTGYNVNTTSATGKVLVITNAGKGAMQTEWEAYGTAQIIANAYYGLNSKKPGYGVSGFEIQYDKVTTASLSADASVLTDIAGFDYDFVLVENDVMGEVIPTNVYNALKNLSVANKFIIYDKTNLSTGGNSGSADDTVNSNYIKLYKLLVYDNGSPRVSNVLPVDSGFFGTLLAAGDAGLSSAKQVADLIDGSNYRGNSGSGAKGKIFKVLEIQPCYPIDLNLASKQSNMQNAGGAVNAGVKGNYYTDTYNVLNGVSKDQVEDGQEYYSFTLSKAKIAYATGLKKAQIQIDQMSTDEFISTKDLPLESYDLIYIGGDHSALIPTEYKSFLGFDSIDRASNKRIFEFTTSFEMYTHTGNLAELITYNTNSGLMSYTSGGQPYGKMKDANGSYATTVTAMNGNDITYLKKQELINYIKAGLPIVFGEDVTSAYEAVMNLSRTRQLAARDIDPDSQMFDFLETVYETYRDENTVVWGADLTEKKVDNFYYVDASGQPTEEETDTIVDNAYGDSLGSQVTVFETETNTSIRNAINESKARPTLIVEEQPKDYVYGDESSYNENTGTMTVKASVKAVTTATNYTLELYVDYDGDNIFDEEDLQDTESYNTLTDEGPKTLTYTIPEGFVGLISWKLVAKEAGGGDGASCSVVKGYAYYKRMEDAEKQEINVLQLMPVQKEKHDPSKMSQSYGDGGETGMSLYLCTECQHALHRANYNIMINGNWEDGDSVYRTVYGYRDTPIGTSYSNFTSGLHEHKFGIIKYDSSKVEYDGTMGAENWDFNLADEAIITENYDINLDILYVDEFEDIITEIEGHTDAEGNSTVKEQIQDGDEIIDVTWKDYYDAQAEIALGKWELAQQELAASGTEEALYEWLSNYIQSHPNSIFRQEDLDAGEYYEFFAKIKNGYYDFSDAAALYMDYIAYKDKEVAAHEEYKEMMRLAGTTGTWLNYNYDMIVLGFAEDFAGNDLSVQACDSLKSYLNNGGNLLTTHDSTTRYADGGSITLTENLRETFGMDRFHMVLDDDVNITVGNVEVENEMDTIIGFRVDTDTGWGTNQRYYGEVGLNPEGVDTNVTLNINASNPDYGIYGNGGTPVYPLAKLERGSAATGTDGNSVITVKLTASDDGMGAGNYVVYVMGTQKFISVDSIQSGYNYVFDVDTSNTDTVYWPRAWEAPYYGGVTLVSATANATGKTTVQFRNKSTGMTLSGQVNLVNTVTNNDTPVGSLDAMGTVDISNYDLSLPRVYLMAVETVEGYRNNGNYILSGEMTYNAETGTYSCEVGATMKTSSTISGGNSILKYLKYTTLPNYDSDKYYMTEWSIYGSDTRELRMQWQARFWNAVTSGQSALGYRSAVGYTDPTIIFETSRNTSPYTYVEYALQDAIHWNQGIVLTKGKGTDRASQVNNGIVTTYPFTLSSELIISGTHSQTYALDMEDSNIAVWYTLGADSTGTKTNSSLYAATPHDGMDNYFIYSKGTIFYCGAGHTMVTGPKRDNNDERRLYINVIINSARNKVAKPTIKIYNPCDEDGHKDCDDLSPERVKSGENTPLNTIYIAADGEYEYTVESKEAIPEFDFKVICQRDIKKVQVYYDLNHEKDGLYSYSDDADHVLITTIPNYVSGRRTRLREDADTYPNLPLKPTYFNGNTTYIIVAATDSNGGTSYKRIRIKYIPQLFDLTDAGSQNVTVPTVMLDVTDKTKFNI